MKTFPFLRRVCAAALAVAFLSGCVSSSRHSMTQYGAIDALLAGAYDGEVTCGELVRKGDLGIGTFDKLDGELILLNGRIHQVRADGRVLTPPASLKTPFAAVVRFRPAFQSPLANRITFQEFQQKLDALLPSTNLVCAFRARGTFASMKTRSVPAQRKPYPSLVEATRQQALFQLGHCRGTVVGFRLPDFVKGINVPGFHAHFLTDTLDAGGHVLDFMLEEGTLEMAVYSIVELRLPKDAGLLKEIDFSRDRSRELDEAER